MRDGLEPTTTSATLARLALRLYPLAYQRRYGEEMRSLLEDQPPRARTVVDLLRGAARAHLKPGDAPAGVVGPADRVRASASAVLLCWVFFAAAGFGYYKTTENFGTASRLHPLVRDAHLAVQALALIATATVVLGALPLIVKALAQARRDPSLRRTVALALLPVIVFGALTAVVIAIAHANGPNANGSGAGGGMAIAWGIAGLACGTACVLACRAALFATPIAPDRLRVALVAGTTVTGAMVAIAAATAVYAIAINLDASNLAAQSNGPYQLLSVTASLIVTVIVMVAAGALATVAVRRGWRVEGQLAST
jgi:hypothetical protein